MVSHEELVAQARRHYARYLRAIILNENIFPIDFRIGKTRRAADYAERVAELTDFRATATALNLTVEWRTVNDPRFGSHERPERAYFATEDAFLCMLEKRQEVLAFKKDLELIRRACPALEGWLPTNVQTMIGYHGIWPELLLVLRWFCENPRSGLYLRQLPVEGVDTKFYERNETILNELLLQIQPEAVDVSKRRFEERHGLRWEEPLIRLRFLDSLLQLARGFPMADFATPAPSFRSLPLDGLTVIVTENLRNFLSMPPLPNAVVIFGGGDAAALLANALWLMKSRILYWGDMDARGYAILGRLRKEYYHTESVLMNFQTLEIHRRWSVKVPATSLEVLGLNADEQAALEILLSEGLRLEQERIPFEDVVQTFTDLMYR